MMKHPLIWMICGFILWSLLFIVFYGLQATGCHMGWNDVQFFGFSLLRIVMVSLLGLSITGMVLAVLQLRKQHCSETDGATAAFASEVGGYIWLAACGAVPLCFAGAIWLTLCGF